MRCRIRVKAGPAGQVASAAAFDRSLQAIQRVVPTGPWYEAMRTGNFDSRRRGELQQRGEPPDRRAEISAARRILRELRAIRRQGADRHLQ
jgi:hypothetical protein